MNIFIWILIKCSILFFFICADVHAVHGDSVKEQNLIQDGHY